MSEYRSEFRESELQNLENKVSRSDYGKYLKKVTLKQIRGFTNREVTFDFPVTALIGPNGGGKSTILGAAALPYKAVKPGTFFAKSGKYDSSMKDWTIEYELIDKQLMAGIHVQRTARFPQARWDRKSTERDVIIFGVSRTIPANERKDLTNNAIGNYFAADSEVSLAEPVTTAVQKILGKSVDEYSKLHVDATGKVSMFAGKDTNGERYSEFHFGAGEASVIRIVSAIEEADKNTLILIEEIENGLHPVATKHMVEYLVEVAEKKSAQIIFTTHSNDALVPLPSSAIWTAYNGEVNQGRLDINTLRAITGQVSATLAIFVEDTFAKKLVSTALRHYGGVEMDAIEIHAVGGAERAIKISEGHNATPSTKYPSICILDGDKKNQENPASNIYTLPGDNHPELHILHRVIDNIEHNIALLTVSMQFPLSKQSFVETVIQQRASTNRDIHLIFQQIGADLSFTSEQVVAGAFLSVWAQENPAELSELIAPFAQLLPGSK
ncbi:AAA domain-containing protein, putative AbiEii toxin, Type IV TA system [Actinopolyspora lacussalsi subsp. righensis]|uniref:AAA domain-containing protein, putative AbiEii toxin, Type IV TA system n=1 Tax=Actinopolyspora righensis TaxID=995060 RepID=A0A1I7BZW2_9ACTN|nr:AAA family ATPase [Actinopolyspora righensis]SFT92701.1 AAA domain-containing protein, putative AbiEii toxin, Type IV TA system [Actinopolyspora righensis]